MTLPYDKNDNDTYTEILGSTPQADVRLHMFRDPTGRYRETDRNGVGIFGNFTSESDAKARDNVLRFAPTKLTGLKLIKTIQLRTLLPMSLVHRYEMGAEKLDHIQSTPIFFDSKLEKFVALMDHRFLRDMSLHELREDEEYWAKFRRMITAYPAQPVKGEVTSIGLLFDTLDELRKSLMERAEGTSFQILEMLYKGYRLSQTGGQKVIIVQGLSTANSRPKLFDKLKSHDHETHELTSSSYNLEFLIAFQFEQRYYAVTKDGKLDQTKMLVLDKQRGQNPSALDELTDDGDKRQTMLILPYTEEQHQMLLALSNRLSSFHQEIMNFFKGSEVHQERLDAPLGQNGHTSLLKQLMWPSRE